MEFLILGPLEVRDGDRLLPVGGGKQRALLAILLTRANEVVSKGRLIDELWQGEPPETAVNGLQVNVSQLRKALPAGVLVTRSPGYSLRVELGELDLHRFERLVEQARRALVASDAEAAAATLRKALAVWRGPALADFVDEPFAQPEIARLEELRLAALERRIEADLALGRHGELIGELERLIADHPLRERLRGQLMLAFYRSGRQAEALGVYQGARRTLVEQLGIEPSEALRELERAILRHDPALDIEPGARAAGLRPARDQPAVERSILVVPQDEEKLHALLALAEPLARSSPARELILARLVPPVELARASALLHDLRTDLVARGVAARAAVFTSKEPGEDIVLLASEQDADLLLLDGPFSILDEGTASGAVGVVLAGAPCDVAVLLERPAGALPLAQAVLVPFGGAEHDWSALELGAWIADSNGVSLKLAGVAADLAGGGRDASRLLARASLIVQKVTGIAAEPLLVEPGEEGLIEAAEGAGLLIIGLPPEWRQQGLGRVRLAVARRARPPVLLVRRGLRPGGIAPQESVTRFTWTLAAPSG